MTPIRRVEEMTNTSQEITSKQSRICAQYGATHCPASPELMIGVSRNFAAGQLPLHGLRHPPEGNSCGWFLWAGEYSTDDDFFQPTHVSHICVDHPRIADYLGLPPGWRFLIAGDHVDVWFDEKLKNV